MKEYKDVAKMTDAIVNTENGSILQHGKLNDRIYLLKLAEDDIGTIAKELIDMAQEHRYSKIVCKIPKKVAPHFFAEGYILEGYIPRFYQGVEDVFFVSKFLNSNRQNPPPSVSMKQLSNLLTTPLDERLSKLKEDDYLLRKLVFSDIQSMVQIYSDVFTSYPFPITDPAYILKTMEQNVLYFGAFKSNNLVAIASSEIDVENRNAEMTDFATQQQHTGNNLAYRLLVAMEEQMKHQNILTLYTIARLDSIPMNKTFFKMGYEYSGTLINNTHIAGDIETMILYYKML